MISGDKRIIIGDRIIVKWSCWDDVRAQICLYMTGSEGREINFNILIKLFIIFFVNNGQGHPM